MALTAAERSKRYRDKKKKSKEIHEEYLEKEHARYKIWKDKGEFDYIWRSEREMSLLRRKWKIKAHEVREKKTMEKKGVEFLSMHSPCTSPDRPTTPPPINHQAANVKNANINIV